MKVVTFNLRYGSADDGGNHWEKRKGLVVRAVRDMKPDIMGVQECLPFQGDEIKSGVPYLDRTGVGRYHGVPQPNRPHEHLSGEHCSIFFNPRKLKLIESGTYWHSGTPEVPGSRTWGNNLPRVTTCGVFEPEDGTGRFTFFNTHFHWDEPYVSNAGRQLAERIRNASDSGRVILVGDFNSTPEDPLYTLMTGRDADDAGLADVWSELGMEEEGAGTGHNFTGEPIERIDWVMHGGGFYPLSIEINTWNLDDRYPSDHFPVAVEFK